MTRGDAFRHGAPEAGLPALHRGLSYGDGLFETMRARGGGIPLWHAHVERLAAGCRRLHLDPPREAVLVAERDRLLSAQPDAVLKLMLWRRPTGHGYDPAGEAGSHRTWTSSPLPSQCSSPLRARWCQLALARQPALAGLKSLNRLEQVLARSEWEGTEWDEGLICDSEGLAISAVAGNLFALIDGRLVTPSLERCGVAGVFRAWMLAQRNLEPRIDVRDILRDEIDRATELFLTNALRGIRPIGTLAGRRYATGAATLGWIRRAREAGLMDAEGDSE